MLWVSSHLSFDLDTSVSVFETNIRVLGARARLLCAGRAPPALTRPRAGGLLSAHLLASDAATGHAARPQPLATPITPAPLC